MTFGLILLVLLAALLHATWNALAKKSTDPLFGIGSFRLFCALASACFIPFVGLPANESWGLLVLSVLIHSVYYFTAAASLKAADLSQIYPIYRGMSPLLIALLAAYFTGEWLKPLQWFAVILISLALLSLAWHRNLAGRVTPQALAWGLTTSLLIACYTVVDGVGVRLAGEPLSYIVWLFALESVPICLYLVLRKRQGFTTYMRDNLMMCIAGGLASAVAYGLVIFAMSLGTIALVSSLRETSVLFAALIGTLFLNEQFGRRRIFAACMVVIGAVLIRLSS